MIDINTAILNSTNDVYIFRSQNKFLTITDDCLYIAVDKCMTKDYYFFGLQCVEDIIYRYQHNRRIFLDFLDGGNIILSGALEFFKKICSSMNISSNRMVIFTYNNIDCDFATVVYQPFSPFIWITYTVLKNEPLLDDSFEKHFGCLVARYDFHRFQIIKHLFEYYRDMSVISCQFDGDEVATRIPSQVHGFYKDDIEWAHNNLPIRLQKLPLKFMSSVEWPDALSNTQNIYSKFFIDVVSETDINSSEWFTEKVFKNFMLGRPFILLAGKEALLTLKKQGFKTFNGLIDESYDTIECNRKRYDYIVKEIDRLSSMSLDELKSWHYSLSETFAHNRNRLAEIYQP